MHRIFNVRVLRSVALALLAGAMIGAFESASAAEIIDQRQELANIAYSQPFTGEAQTFRPAYNNITAVGLWIYGTGSVTVQLFDAACGTLLGTGTAVSSGDGWLKVGLGALIRVIPEAEYAFYVDGTMLAYAGGNPDPYARGEWYYECGPSGWPYDMTFRTYADDTILPVTSPAWAQVKTLYR